MTAQMGAPFSIIGGLSLMADSEHQHVPVLEDSSHVDWRELPDLNARGHEICAVCGVVYWVFTSGMGIGPSS